MKLRQVPLVAIMVVIAIIFLAPFAFMLLASFKNEAEVLKPDHILPHAWTSANYAAVAKNSVEAPVGLWFVNSIFVSSATTLVVVAFSSMTAFAITRIKVRGSSLVLGGIVTTMMIPPQLRCIHADGIHA